MGHTALAQVVQQLAQTCRTQLVIRVGAGGEVDEGLLVLAQGPQPGFELLDEHALEVAPVRSRVQHGAQCLQLRGQGAVLRDRLRDAAGHTGADIAAGQLPQLLSLLRGGEQARVHVRDLRAGAQELAGGLLEAVALEEAHVAAHRRAVLRGARRGQQIREAVLEDLRRERVERGPDLLEQQERTAPGTHSALRVETGLAQDRQSGLGERGHQLAGADGPLLRPGDLVRGVDAGTEPDGVAHLHREGAHAGLLQQSVAHGRALLRRQLQHGAVEADGSGGPVLHRGERGQALHDLVGGHAPGLADAVQRLRVLPQGGALVVELVDQAGELRLRGPLGRGDETDEAGAQRLAAAAAVDRESLEARARHALREVDQLVLVLRDE